MTLDIHLIRKQYPALSDGSAYLDGAGGTQLPDSVRHARQLLVGSSVPPPRNSGAIQVPRLQKPAQRDALGELLQRLREEPARSAETDMDSV